MQPWRRGLQQTDMNEPHSTLKSALPSLLFMMVTVFYVMYGRLLFAPLLVPMKESLQLTTGEAARFFLWISLGYTVSILISGYLSSLIHHRRTIAFSVFLLAMGLFTVSQSQTLVYVRVGLLVLGFGAGLYPPSGVSTATSLVTEGIRGRAVALHEVGPGAAFVLAPFFASLLLRVTDWRGVLLVSAIGAFILSITFLLFSPAGNFPGSPPHLSHIRTLAKQPLLWAVGAFLTLAASSTYGVFSILPTYLVDEEGFALELVNAVIGASRISGVLMVFFSGWLIDKLGTSRLIAIVILVTGLLTMAIGLTTGTALLVAVFLQPVVISAFFPAALASFAYLGPPELRNVGVSIVIPIANLTSGGLFPSIMGALGDGGRTGLGFFGFGILMILSLFLLPLLNRGISETEAVAP